MASSIRKSKRKILEEIYDNLYAQAEEVLKQFNPCQHKNIGNKDYSCLSLREEGDYYHNIPIKTGCCGGCKFLTQNGCSAEKPLNCKVWLCGIARMKNPEVAKKLDEIAKKVSIMGFKLFRGDKQEIINRLLNKRVLNYNLGTFKNLTKKDIVSRAELL